MTNDTEKTETHTPTQTAFLEIVYPGPGIDLKDVRGAVAVALIETGVVTLDTKCTDLNGGKVMIKGEIETGKDYQQFQAGIEQIRQAIGSMRMEDRVKPQPEPQTPNKRARAQKPESIHYPGIDHADTNQPTMIDYLTPSQNQPGGENIQEHFTRVTKEAYLKGKNTTGR